MQARPALCCRRHGSTLCSDVMEHPDSRILTAVMLYAPFNGPAHERGAKPPTISQALYLIVFQALHWCAVMCTLQAVLRSCRQQPSTGAHRP